MFEYIKCAECKYRCDRNNLATEEAPRGKRRKSREEHAYNEVT